MEREGATELAKEYRAAAYALGYLDAECVEGDRFKSAKEDCDHLEESVVDALCEEPATPPGECVLALQAEQELLAWLEKQLEKHTRARDIMDLRIESLADFRTATATVVAKMEEFIALQ